MPPTDPTEDFWLITTVFQLHKSKERRGGDLGQWLTLKSSAKEWGQDLFAWLALRNPLACSVQKPHASAVYAEWSATQVCHLQSVLQKGILPWVCNTRCHTPLNHTFIFRVLFIQFKDHFGFDMVSASSVKGNPAGRLYFCKNKASLHFIPTGICTEFIENVWH